MAVLELALGTGQSSFSVHRFHVEEGLSRLFSVAVEARSSNDDVDLESIVGKPARLHVASDLLHNRVWTGVCTSMEQTRVEPSGLSTYELTLAPQLWLLTQRRNQRIFQHLSIPDIVGALLGEWGVTAVWQIERAAYPRLELRTQYGESDYAFVARLLEEAGITFYHRDDLVKGSELVLDDRPHARDLRAAPPVPFVDSPGQAQSGQREYVTGVRLRHDVRPGRHTVRDFDFRRPAYALGGSAVGGADPEPGYEQYHYLPGATLVEMPPQRALAETSAGLAALGATPVADDKGTARFSEPEAEALARRRLEADRGAKRSVRYQTDVIALAPGVVFTMGHHPRADLREDKRLLVTDLTLSGTYGEEWQAAGQARFADAPHRPPLVTPKPRLVGQQSAVVTGPPGEEIYTDEFGRVRVQLRWDRLGHLDDASSIWMRVSQGWAGPGYGFFTVPRVGHEVLVSYLEGDLDSPYVSGRLFNGVDRVPHKLPENKTVSTLKTDSSPSTGGFNELRFDDAAGREHVYLQAERDLDKLIKNDEMSAVGNNRTRLVQKDEAVTIGQDRTTVVHKNELEVAGLHRTAVVGVNRNTIVGVDDTTLVGSKFSVTMARGLTARLTEEISSLVQGPLGPVVSAPIATVLGMIPQTPLGGVLSELARGPLARLVGLLPGTFRNVLGVMDGLPDAPGPAPTTFEMVDRRITFTNGEASIILDGPNITLMADGNIMMQAKGNVGLLADGEAAVAAQGTVLVLSKSDDLVLQGGPNVHLNPHETQTALYHERAEELAEEGYEWAEGEHCEECGAPMLARSGETPMCAHIITGGSSS
jgi:type VI secretion system secreted protein VgrG